MEKEVRIQVPEGMQIDKENSTFECIKFKPIEKKRWRDNPNSFFMAIISPLHPIYKNVVLFS